MQNWRESQGGWLLSAWKRSAQRKQILAALGCSHQECENDLPILIELAEMREDLDQYANLVEITCGLWQGAESDDTELAAALEFGKKLTANLAALPLSAGQFNQLCSKLESYLKTANAQLGPSGDRKALLEFAQAEGEHAARLEKLQDVVKYNFGAIPWQERRQAFEGLLEQKANLQAVAQWQNFYRSCKASCLEGALDACARHEPVMPGDGQANLTAGESGRFLGSHASQADKEILKNLQARLEALNQLAWLSAETGGFWHGSCTNLEEGTAALVAAQATESLARAFGENGKAAYQEVLTKISADPSLRADMVDAAAAPTLLKRQIWFRML